MINKKISELNGKLTVANEQKLQYEEQIKNAKIWEVVRKQGKSVYAICAYQIEGNDV
mgnify:CR=1 FL=1